MFLYRFAFLLAAYFGFVPALAHAQYVAPGSSGSTITGTLSTGGAATPTMTATVTAPAGCVTLPVNLFIGVTDASTGGAVTRLQTFLAERGFFDSRHLGTGRFGPITRAAVIRFQGAREIPPTGFVGPITRASISSFGCGINPTPSPVPTPAEPAPDLQSLEPSSAATGDTVTITGSGFTTSNNVLIDGMLMAQNVPVASTVSVSCMVGDTTCQAGLRQTLRFTVRDYVAPHCPPGMFCAAIVRPITSGKYLLTVQNDNGISDGLILTINATTTR